MTSTSAQDITAKEIIKRTTAAYESLQTYKAEGTIESDIDAGGMKIKAETRFSILLKKPNLYLISWTQNNLAQGGMAQDGAVWSDGTQPYLYMGALNAYSKIATNEAALAGATGISSGAASTLPAFFFRGFRGLTVPLLRLTAPRLERTEKIGDEEFYVVSGPSDVSKQETFWISKSSYLVAKYVRNAAPNEGGMKLPEISDKQIDESLRTMGQKMTDENRRSLREQMTKTQDQFRNRTMKGSITETHVKISAPELTGLDFRFSLPRSAVLKDSLLDISAGNENR